jgi:hypothetical protein
MDKQQNTHDPTFDAQLTALLRETTKLQEQQAQIHALLLPLLESLARFIDLGEGTVGDGS